ncbi:hypothetical protein L1987_13143 [Smallanthus sonchifolius]|uniref:Uncharacterized protein n=1 Tax=Smallanthus sonchifolius TaxID=185202 RepID=A0ACB9JI08_9ASTR|nr:hypothetical protein L1987_13143 [Smallanthus sonchifolius]
MARSSKSTADQLSKIGKETFDPTVDDLFSGYLHKQHVVKPHRYNAPVDDKQHAVQIHRFDVTCQDDMSGCCQDVWWDFV